MFDFRGTFAFDRCPIMASITFTDWHVWIWVQILLYPYPFVLPRIGISKFPKTLISHLNFATVKARHWMIQCGLWGWILYGTSAMVASQGWKSFLKFHQFFSFTTDTITDKMVLSFENFLPLCKGMTSKMRSITIEHLSSSIDTFNCSEIMKIYC